MNFRRGTGAGAPAAVANAPVAVATGSPSAATITEKLDKFIEVSTKARKDREKVSEVQQNLANNKLEAAKLAHKAAQEQVKCKMLDTYKELLLAPTSNLSAHALAEREKALESMRMVLFATDN
uniref:Uncharacterized protein n=1 Tax=Setaria viridis TaxID=4556 RepID=A0A4U6VDF0_SETVI|nr:hypothetical protein SEVIR_3G150200v2 [Setaria viridis]